MDSALVAGLPGLLTHERAAARGEDDVDHGQWTREHIKKEQTVLDSELVKIMSDNDPGALRLKNVRSLPSLNSY